MGIHPRTHSFHLRVFFLSFFMVKKSIRCFPQLAVYVRHVSPHLATVYVTTIVVLCRSMIKFVLYYLSPKMCINAVRSICAWVPWMGLDGRKVQR